MGKKIGLLLRSYAKKEEDVPGVVARAVKSIEYASSLCGSDGKSVFSVIVVVIPRDYDCGATGAALKNSFTLAYSFRVGVLEPSGHHSCGALNEGIDSLASKGIDYAVIVSNKAIEALTADTVEAMLETFDKGAKVVGVTVDELQDVVLEGRIQNTFAVWDTQALLAVGGFDSELGVEEVAPTVRLIREYGPCIALLDPKEKPALNIRQSTDGKARHDEVMSTKLARQQEEVLRVGSSFDFIKSGIMSDYPKTV